MIDPGSIQARLQALRDSYTKALPDKLAEIRTLWEKLRGEPAPGDLKTLRRQVHSLAGSGATFGYVQLGDAARVVETLLNEWFAQGEVPDETCIARLEAGFAALELAAVAEGVNVQNVINPETRALDAEIGNRLIYLVEDDFPMAQALSLQIQNFGYDVRLFANPDALKAAFGQQLPAAVIMDIMFPQDDLAGPRIIGELERNAPNPPPVIYISARDDLPARLAAVRANSAGYFVKPVDVTALIDMLDRLTAHRVTEAYRILIVDDDHALADHYALTLRHAGMEVVTVNHPLEIMTPLLELKPDLILMDVYMPVCDGLELAAVLRQQPKHDSIPIVFLSTEVDADMRLRALHLGADDFLHKPILPDHLVTSVRSRARRARVLRAHMIHDSLTGLFNHSATKDFLQHEFHRARRSGRPMAFCMLDLDYFKAVNDDFGHATGDRVLKTLASLLQQRLRKSDFIGRLGGEEFAVVFTDTNVQTAARILDEIRSGFAKVKHYCDRREFNATFSCGIATLDNGDDPAAIYQAADRALYQAKHAGRDRVVVAQGREAAQG